MTGAIRIGLVQAHTKDTLKATLSALEQHVRAASAKSITILLFPEAYLGGYPRTCNFGAAIGSRTAGGREQFLQYFQSAVDLGDTFTGGGPAWLEAREGTAGAEAVANGVAPNQHHHYRQRRQQRGDGTRETLERIARETGVFIVTGLVERAGGSLFCATLAIDPVKGVVGKHRKVQPTGVERLVWAQGDPASLAAVSVCVPVNKSDRKTDDNDFSTRTVQVILGTAICWENYMPLLRYSLYAQGVNLWLAPTADPRVTWAPLMQTIACEGRCFVMSANQAGRTSDLPVWIRREYERQQQQEGEEMSPGVEATGREEDEWQSRGGSLICDPMGNILAGPAWEQVDEILHADIDLDDCTRAKMDFDVTGHYSRHDAFHLTVDGLDLTPPPPA